MSKSHQGEPECLRRGKRFHRQIQEEWEREAEGEVSREHGVIKPSGRRGRVDVLVDAGGDMVAVVEIKASDWDAMTDTAVRRNVKRQSRQIWAYIESQLRLDRDVSPGITFPKRPANSRRLQLIEKLFEDDGIPVVWADESIEERKARGEA